MQETTQSTKERLLDAAEHLFGEAAFDEVSIRELAAAADVNVAAVNYHFQGKENLYHEVIRRRFILQRDLTLDRLQRIVDAGGDRPALDAVIRAMVREQLHGALATTSGMRIMGTLAREMHTNHGTQHMVAFKVLIAPLFAAFSGAMLAARPHLTQDDANWLIASTVGQVHHFIMRRAKYDSLSEDHEIRPFMRHAFPVLAAPVEEYVDEVTDHITRYSVAAIDGLHPEETS